jgi:type II secretory pathway component PulF
MLNVVSVATFFGIAITPVYQDLFADFGLELPAVTELAYSTLPNIILVASPLIMPLVGLSLLIAVFAYFALNTCSMPGLDHLSKRRSVSRLLEIMGADVQRETLITESLSRIANSYPHRYFARKLQRAAAQTSQGVPGVMQCEAKNY